MFKKFIFLIPILSLAFSGSAHSAWVHGKTITKIQIVEHGGFILYFDSTVNGVCTNAGINSLYIYPNENSVTDNGAKAMLSTSLTAFSTGMKVDVMYDDTVGPCWGRYLAISN